MGTFKWRRRFEFMPGIGGGDMMVPESERAASVSTYPPAIGRRAAPNAIMQLHQSGFPIGCDGHALPGRPAHFDGDATRVVLFREAAPA